MTTVEADPLRTPGPTGRRGVRLFADHTGQGRSRRASDLIMLGLTIVGVGMLSLATDPPSGFEKSVNDFLDGLPTALDGVWQVMADLPLLIALVIIVATIVRTRTAIFRDLLLAGVVACIVWALLSRLIDGDWPPFLDSIRRAEPPPLFPAGRLAIPGAMLITASPHLVSPMRKLDRWVLGLACISTVVLQSSAPSGAIAGLLLAAGSAALVHLAVGSSAGRPSLDDVAEALDELGVAAADLGAAESQPAGVFVVDAVEPDGTTLSIKVYGRDAHDAALVNRAWHTVWMRDPGSATGFGRLQQVEHEAFLTLLAAQAGIATDRILTAGATATDDAVLVLRRRGTALDQLPDDQRAAALGQLWGLVGRLHDADIAHGEIDSGHLISDDGELGLIGFRAATVAATRQQFRADQVQALITTMLIVGEDEALDAAKDALGNDELAAVLPFVQAAALTSAQRRLVKDRDVKLDDFRARAADAVGIEAPKLQQLRRFTVGSVVRIGLPLLALYMVASAVANFDFAEIADELSEATWWIIAIGFVVAQLPRLAQAVATLGAAPVPLPLGPVYALQLSVSYINLAIPSSAARMAVNIRFFQRHGVPPGGALAAGALDGLSGFVVQAFILVSMLLFGSASLNLDVSSSSSSSSSHLILIILIGCVIAIAVVLAVGRFRRFVVHWGRQIGSEAGNAIKGLRSPRRLAMLFGGNIASELLFASALGLMARGFGADIGLAELLFINVCVSLLAGVIPIPGGIGVTEGGLTYGLVQAGMSQEAAFAAVIMYRIATFYLPPVWGFFSLRWLERNQHL